MSIKQSELQDLARSFFEAVREGIGSADAISELFVSPNPQLVAPDGTWFDAASHQRLHERFSNEKHILGEFELVQICDDPERARAKGWVYFEALYKDHPERGLLKSIVGEEYILERCEDGRVRYVQYNSTFFAPLPDSAPFDIR